MSSSAELNESLYNAAFDNDIDQVHHLVKLPNVNVNATHFDGEWTALMTASERGHLAVVQCLLETGKANVDAAMTDGCTALLIASENGHLTVVQCLLQFGKANVEAADINGWTALYAASLRGHLPVVQCLLETGKANVEATNINGWTALMAASFMGHLAVVQCLLETGKANVEAANMNGMTALYVASYWGNLAMVQCLVESGGANIHATTNSNDTALDIAKDKGRDDVVAYLQQQHQQTTKIFTVSPLPPIEAVPSNTSRPAPALAPVPVTTPTPMLNTKQIFHECDVQEDGTDAAISEQKSSSPCPVKRAQTCELCSSFPKMVDATMCRMCWNFEPFARHCHVTAAVITKRRNKTKMSHLRISRHYVRSLLVRQF
jgi:ankyrin repeat protein